MAPMSNSCNDAWTSTATECAPPSSDSLQYYLNHIYSNRLEPTEGPLPHFSARPSSGVLDHDRVNRVLLFDGCFDPPHTAHLKLLEYVYTQARTRLNIVGAIILPLSEHSCSTEARNRKNHAIWNNEPLAEGHDIHYQLAERMKLWYEDPKFPSWASVLDIATWTAFRHHLIKATRNDGYELRFTLLRGVDHLRLGTRVFHALQADELISSDMTRKAEFATENGLLRLGEGATPWTIWNVEKSLQDTGTISIPEEGGMLSALATSQRLIRGCIEDSPIYFCRVNETQDLVLFIPRLEEADGGEHRGLSSTLVRKLMKVRQIDPRAMTGEVANLVLGLHRRSLCGDVGLTVRPS